MPNEIKLEEIRADVEQSHRDISPDPGPHGRYVIEVTVTTKAKIEVIGNAHSAQDRGWETGALVVGRIKSVLGPAWGTHTTKVEYNKVG